MPSRVRSVDGQELEIPDLQYEDAGQYECLANNTVGPVVVRIFVVRVECKLDGY